MTKIMIGFFTLVSLVVLSACGTSNLNGAYIGTYGFQDFPLDATLEFNGDGESVVWIDEVDSLDGTYEINEEELLIDLDGFTITADLIDDRESFTVSSSSTGI